MDKYEFISQNAVMVNGGSGVLFNGMTDEYTYVLTARHVLSSKNVVTNLNGKDLQVRSAHSHADTNIDCSIIVVEYQPDAQSGFTVVKQIEHHAKLLFGGFPETERKKQNKYKTEDGKLSSTTGDQFIFTSENLTPKEDIIGMSGSGVYFIQGDTASLVGIELEMEGGKQAYGKMRCQDLTRYHEIIAVNDLPPLLPFHLTCFSHVLDKIFEYAVVNETSIAILKKTLLGFPANWIKSETLPTPIFLMQNYSESLILGGEHPETLKEFKLWVAYLEFIVISSLIDKVKIIDQAYIAGLDRKRRIVYTTEPINWLKKLDRILEFAKNYLDVNGSVIVSSAQSDALIQPPPALLDRIAGNIFAVDITDSDQRIDAVENNLYKSLKIRHLKALHHKCVVSNEFEYETKTLSEQINFFTDQYNALIN